MILSDLEIRELCAYRGLLDPYDSQQVEPASYDVRLGQDFLVFERDATTAIDLNDPVDITKKVHIEYGDYFLLHPGEFVLGVTLETVNMPHDLVARIEGKSSVGRLGLMVHVTAGYVDPGFCGPITLEMASLHPLPIMLRPGKLIAQLSFHRMSKPAEKPYAGRYQNAAGVEASRYEG
jgi:dCTP deaminase